MIKAEAVLVLGDNVKKLKNKKYLPLIAIVALVAVAGIGAVIAFGSDKAMFNNNFAVADYKTVAEENFSSPDDWTPCTETPKVATMTNNGNVPVVVRMKIEEWWRDAADTQDLPLVKDGVTLAEIKTQNESDWELKGDGWYYYKELLAPGQTTTSLLKAVKLDCSANFGGENVCTDTAEGKVCEKPADAYENAKYHLKVTFQTGQQGSITPPTNTLAGVVCTQASASDPTVAINFAQLAVKSDDPAVANGNGANYYTENGTVVCYYRGDIDYNNVIWADMCWKMVRTTAAGGVKLMYFGEPTEVNGVKQCTATGANTAIRYNNATYFRFNENYNSPADVGYMYGDRLTAKYLDGGSITYTFANDVSYDNGVYTLSTGAGQSISGNWRDTREAASVKYHYFCTDGATSCDSTKIGYIIDFYSKFDIYYLNIGAGGYANIETAKAAMFANEHDSAMKTTLEGWFESKNLDGHVAGTRNYEDDLEDAIYCNDRELYSGSLKGKDADATFTFGVGSTRYSYYASYGRNVIKNAQDNVEPSLDCNNPRDAFQVSNNDAKLKHKVGLITADELTMAGASYFAGHDCSYYLCITRDSSSFTMTPYSTASGSNVFMYITSAVDGNANNMYQVRPMVTLKSSIEYASGTGLPTDPYIVE